MKSLLIIPIIVAAIFGVALTAGSMAGISMKMHEAVTAGAIAAIAGVIGLLPILWARRVDVVAAAQAALAGTVLHLLTQIALAAAVIGCHHAGVAFVGLSIRGAFALWLLVGYWISLAALTWQLRRIVVGVSKMPAVTQPAGILHTAKVTE